MSIQVDIADATVLRSVAREHGFSLSDDEIGVFTESIAAAYAAHGRLADLDVALRRSAPTSGSARREGGIPAPADNPFGAWAWTMSLTTEASGPLRGKRIAIKDNVAVAGAPMRNGSALLDDFTAREDATVVERILAAGGTIAGKAVCENLCFSGGSHTSYPGPVENPVARGYMTGGSSSGCAALIANGDVDMAIGGDQGGSVRIPASWCGIVGLKPTWGLVPYTGAFPIEPSLDHLGPMARSVEDVATLLDVIAGRDGLDARQCDTPFERTSYLASMHRYASSSKSLRIGLLREGFGWTGVSHPDVDALVREVVDAFGRAEGPRVEVVDISVPMHRQALDIWSGIATEGAWATMVRDNGVSHGAAGYHDVALVEHYARQRASAANEFSPTVKTVILLGALLHRHAGGVHYARAQNVRRALREAYDTAFEDVDVLVMPTTPQLPTRLSDARGLTNYLGKALDMLQNTAAFDATGHPALSIPCGRVDALPIGLMLVARRFDEAALLGAGSRLARYIAGRV